MKIIQYCAFKNNYCLFDWQFSEPEYIGCIGNLKLTENYNIVIGNIWSGLYASNTRLYWKPLGFERGIVYA